MKTKSIFAIIMVLSFAVSTAFSQSVTLDGVSGLNGSGYIPVDGGTVTFAIGMNTNGSAHTGITNGFSVSSPDGATWTTTVGDTIPAGWDAWLDLVFAINRFSIDGALSDTIGFGGASLFGGGLPATFNQSAYTITIGPFDEADRGKTIVIDSCFYQPTGVWKWAGPTVYPTWDGPHTYTVDPPELSDDIIAAPDTLIFAMLTDFEGTMTDSFLVSSSGADFDFNLSEGSPWFTLSQANGTTPEYILVNVTNPGPEGIHTSDIEITSASAVNSPQFVTVKVEVVDPPKILEISEGELYFNVVEKHTSDMQSVIVTELNDYNIDFEVVHSGDYIQIVDSLGTTPDSVDIYVYGQSVGDFVDTVYYTYEGAPQDGTVFSTTIYTHVSPNHLQDWIIEDTTLTINECDSLFYPIPVVFNTDIDGDTVGIWVEPDVIEYELSLYGDGYMDYMIFKPTLEQAGTYELTLYYTDYYDTTSTTLTLVIEDCDVQYIPKAVMQPEIVYAFFSDAINPMTGRIYFGDFEVGHTAADVDFSTIQIDGSIATSGNSIVSGPEGFSGDVVLSEFDMNSYLELYQPFFDSTIQEFTVSGQFADAIPFSITGAVVFRGHLSGDLNLDGVVDIGDLVIAVEFAFQEGPAPQYIESLDLNKDGSADITDIILLIRMMF